MELWTAFLLGSLGSLHCAGMCGPLVLALPGTGGTRTTWLLGRVAYNAGRLATYCALGAGLGLVGQTFALAGLQRWLSLAAGILLLVALATSSRFSLGLPATATVGWMKRGFATLLRQRTFSSLLLLGTLNGLLPCGLVYAATAGAVVSHSPLAGATYMLVFGLGTVPMMLTIALAGQKLPFALRLKLQPLIPASLAIVGVLLILRGLALGIPYLSPALTGACPACH